MTYSLSPDKRLESAGECDPMRATKEKAGEKPALLYLDI
jgi:hypothetical protein